MKLIFIGDIEFGRNKDKICKFILPSDIISIINKNDYLFFNLETVLLSNKFNINKNKLENKDINIYSYTENNIKYINDTINIPTFVSTINNHTFDYNINGYYNTLKILDKYNFKFTVEKSYYIDNNFIYLNATDHWTIIEKNNINYPENRELWNNHCLLIDTPINEEYTYKLIEYLNKIKENRKIIFSIHWGRNFENNTNENTYLYNKIESFFKKICDLGVDIVFGHGSHHIVDKYYEIYNNKLIIYGLGDYSGDFVYKQYYSTDKSIMLIYDTNSNECREILLKGDYIPYQGTDNNLKCKYSYILDNDLNNNKKPNGGGNTFAHEIERLELIPYLNKYKIKIDKINKNLIYNNKKISYQNYFNTNLEYVEYCRNKELSNIIYDKHNIPYPKTIKCKDLKNNKNNIIFPVLLKPINGSGGRGIISDIMNISDLKYNMNKINTNEYIIQEQVKGKTYRILVLNNKIIYIRYYPTPSITGNGKDSIDTLIDKLNNKLKKVNSSSYVKFISYDYIKSQGYERDNILEKNKKIYITNVINYWNGAQEISFIKPDDIHPINIELFIHTAKSFKLNFIGIDYITSSLALPYYLSNGNIIEVNWKPGFQDIFNNDPEIFIQSLIEINPFPGFSVSEQKNDGIIDRWVNALF